MESVLNNVISENKVDAYEDSMAENILASNKHGTIFRNKVDWTTYAPMAFQEKFWQKNVDEISDKINCLPKEQREIVLKLLYYTDRGCCMVRWTNFLTDKIHETIKDYRELLKIFETEPYFERDKKIVNKRLQNLYIEQTL